MTGLLCLEPQEVVLLLSLFSLGPALKQHAGLTEVPKPRSCFVVRAWTASEPRQRLPGWVLVYVCFL